ncbi:MAG: alkaline phosphatase family protein [Anaerolineae bacterium]|nr:alkaline phosphatase family protein [Anaerolineae bacterium]
MIYSMVDVAPTVSTVLGVRVPAGAQGAPIPEILRDLTEATRVAVLAPDAFGWFAWTLWQAEMPYLQTLHAEHSLILRSVMPSITPVNFATMVTGADLDGHGVRTRDHDFQCETLFDVVRRAGGLSAAVGFEGYTGSSLLARYADIDGTTVRGTDDVIAEKVIEIARADAPEFLIAQLGRVDDVFHEFGPSSAEVLPMLRDTDARLRRLVKALRPLGYGVIILADHGQHDIADDVRRDDDSIPKKGGHGQDRDEDRLVPCTWL